MAAIREDHLEAERLISHDLERRLWSLKGKWVVVTHEEIVAVGDSPSEALEKAKETNPSLEGLLLHHVPEDEERLHFF